MNTAIRAQAVQSALAKYRDTEFAWGSNDCLHLFRTVMIKMGAKGLPKIPTYRTERTALKRLAQTGHDSLENLLLDHCIEIAPAWGVVGDIGTVQGEEALSAIVIRTDNGKWLGWSNDDPDTDVPVFKVVNLLTDQLRLFRLPTTQYERDETARIIASLETPNV